MKVGRLVIPSILLVLVLLLAACAAPSGSAAPLAAVQTESDSAPSSEETSAKNADGYAEISVDQLAAMMEDKDFTLVNVHIPYQGELPETDLFIPYDEIADETDALPDKDAPIVLYCQSGGMSALAAKTLADMGYANVLELDGGFNAWQAAGNELLNTQ